VADTNPFSDPSFGSDVAPDKNPFSNPDFGRVTGAGEEIAHGAERGARQGLAHIVSSALKYTGKPGDALYGAGEKVGAVADAWAKAHPEFAAQPESHGTITNLAAQGAEMATTYAPMMAIGAALPGAVLPAAAVAAPFAMSSGQETYEKAKAAGKSEDEAVTAGREAAGVQAAAMGIAGPVAGKLVGGAVGGVAKALAPEVSTATGAAAKALTPPSFGPALGKAAISGGAENVAMMEAGAAGQAGVEQEHGIGTQTPGEAAVEALPGSLGAALLFSPLGALHASKAVQEGKTSVKAVTDALSDPADKNRFGAVRSVYDAMFKADPEGANMWALNAGEALRDGKPIGVTTDWTTGLHPDLFPEAKPKEPTPLALPAPGQVPIPMDSSNYGPTEQSTAADESAAARDTARTQYEAEQARLRASGPLGEAAAAGMDSGAVAAKAAERQAAIPEDQIGTFEGEGGSTKTATPTAEQKQAQANIASVTRNTPGVSLRDAQDTASVAASMGKDYTVIPHPAGGFAAIPTHFLTPDIAESNAGLQASRPAPAEPAKPSFPFAAPEAAQARARQLTMETGTEHEVVPHPMARDKFAVQPKDAFTQREQAVPRETGDENAVQEPSAGEVLQRQPGEAGVAGGERGRVEQGVQGQEATRESEAAGRKLNIDAGIQPGQDSLAAHGVTAEPPDGRSLAAIEHGAKGLKPHETQAIAGLFQAAKDAGHNMSMFHGANFATTDVRTDPVSGKATNGLMAVFPHSKQVLLRGDLLKRLVNGAGDLQHDFIGYLRHEGWHLADVHGSPDAEPMSSTHPAFKITTDAQGKRTATGGIMKEAFDAFSDPNTATSKALHYPLRDWLVDHKDVGAGSAHEWSRTLQNEVFAQLGRFHDQHPELMKEELPKAFRLFQEIKDNTDDKPGNAVGRAVQQTLRAHGPLRGAYDDDAAANRSGDAGSSGQRETGAGLGEQALHVRDEGRATNGSGERGRLAGLPKSSPGPFAPAQSAAARYMKAAGRPYTPPKTFVRVDSEYGARVAKAYAEMKDDPDNPAVKRAYKALIKETVEQWHAMMKTGLKVDFTDADHPYPYKNPHDAVKDVRDNNHLTVFSTDEGFGDHLVNIGLHTADGRGVTKEAALAALKGAGVRVSENAVHQSDTEPTLVARLDRPLTAEEAHRVSEALGQESIAQKSGGKGELYGPGADKWRPFQDKYFLDMEGKPSTNRNPLLAPTDIKVNGKTLLANDVFRAVHDYFGHVMNGVGFRADGEENAWRSHAAMYSDEARKAMTTETRGQNSWLNWGPHGEENRTAKTEDTVFADQKTGLLPNEFAKDNYAAGVDKLPPEMMDNLTPQQQRALGEGRGRADRAIEIFNAAPPAEHYLAAAQAGEAARKWYQNSLDAISKVYGDDHRQFLQLMAALSPQTSVKLNFFNAARVWAAWEVAGRTNDTAVLKKIFNKHLVTEAGRDEGKIAMKAWTNNAIRVLTASDPSNVRLSGPKVSAFMENLLGHYAAVTNDRHMADFAGISETVLRGIKGANGLGVEGPGYMALSAKVREAARTLDWTPAETQAAIWSWWNSLKRLAVETGKSAVQLIRDGDLTRERIAQEPHLGSYLHGEEYRSIEPVGSERVARGADLQRHEDGGFGPGGGPEGSSSAPGAALEANARRIDENLRASGKYNRGDAYEGDLPADEAGLDVPFNVKDRGDIIPEREPKPPFYSGMDRAIAEKAPFAKDGTISAQMLRNWLEARTKDGLVKRDELNWTGLDDYLKLQDGKISRDQIKQFLDQNGVKVTESVLGNIDIHDVEAWWNDEGGANEEKPYNDLNRAERQEAEARYLDEVANYEDGAAKYADRVLPGGKNYRELLLTLPQTQTRSKTDIAFDMFGKPYRNLTDEERFRVTPEFQKEMAKAKTDFQSSHFDQPNILAHVRFNERTDANGKKVLFIEELQSDWAQNGRREGFRDDKAEQNAKAAAQALKPAFDAAETRREKARAVLAEQSNRLLRSMGISGYSKIIEAGPRRAELTAQYTKLKENDDAYRSAKRESDASDDEVTRLAHEMGETERAGSQGDKTPAAPFVGKTEAWVALAMKRMIRYAADNGFDRVAWTNGDQQSSRYDLSKQVDKISVGTMSEGRWQIFARKNNEVVIDRVADTDADLAGLIGKDLAEKAIAKKGGSFSGLDLKVGGEGMKSFYDKIVPNVANDVLKKLGGGRVTDVYDAVQKYDQMFRDRPPVMESKPQPGFDITPAMKAKVLEGQPLFVKDDGSKIPERQLETKLTGRAEEQQFTKSGEPVEERPREFDPHDIPKWADANNPDELETLRRAGLLVPKETFREKVKGLKHEAGLRILQGTVDQFASIMSKLGEMPYKLARMASSYDAALETMMHFGQVYLNSAGAIARRADTKGVLDILKPLQGETERFFAWYAGQRAERLMAEGKENNFDAQDIQRMKSFNEKRNDKDNLPDGRDGKERKMLYASVLKDFKAMQKSVLDLAEKSGTLDPELRKVYESQDYLPFYREAEDGADAVKHGNLSGMVNQYFSKKLKGGDRALGDLLQNTIQNWSHVIQSSLKNNAAIRILSDAEKKGFASEATATEKGAMFVMVDGAKKYYVVHDALLLDAVSALEASPFKVPKSLAWFKHALTVGTTLSPVFRVRHTIREQIASLILGHGSYNPVKNWIDGFQYSSRNNPEYGNMLAGGSFFRMGYGYEDNRAAYFKQLLAHGIDPANVLDSESKIKSAMTGAWDWWKETGERSDSITRANRYRNTFAEMIASGKNADEAHFEAAYAARATLDYGLHGTWPAIKMITGVVPFMNARLQGLYVIGKAAAADPKRFAAVVGGITLATMALTLAYRDDKEMQAREEWDRDNNWAFRVGDKVFRVPKPFELGAIATVADRALQTALDGFTPADRERFVERLWPIIGSQLNLNPIASPVIATPIQLWGNKDWFTGRRIESEREANLSPSERYGVGTSQTARLASRGNEAIAKALPFISKTQEQGLTLSPEQIDFAVNSLFGWVGAHAIMTADLAVRPAVGAPNRPAARINDIPVLGDFVKDLPENSSKDTEAFYNHLTRVQQAIGDLRMLQKTGQVEAAAQALKDNKQEIQLYGLYTNATKQLGILAQRERWVNMRDMDPDQKREELNRLAQLKNNITRVAEASRATAVNSQ
jgi:hypothetical protein